MLLAANATFLQPWPLPPAHGRQGRCRQRAAAPRASEPPAADAPSLAEMADSSKGRAAGSSLASPLSKSRVTAGQPLLASLPPAASPRPIGLAGRVASLGEALQQTATRLRRQLEPPPPRFPPGPGGDVAVQLLQQPLPFLEQLRRQHGPLVGLLLGGERVVLVADPEAARAVLVEGGDVFVKSGTAFFPGSSLTGNGLLVSDGEVWRRQRRLANPAFRRSSVEQYAQAMLDSTTGMLASSWRDGAARDVYADFNRLTLDTTLRALFGAQLAADGAAALEITDSIQAAFRFFAARGAAALALPEWLPTPDNLAFTAAVARLDRAVLGLIAQRRRELAAAPRPPSDLLDSLLTAADEAGRGMGDRAARDEAMTLLVAGQETSAIVLAWACAYLAHHPRAQAAAAAEVQAALGGRAAQAGDASRLPVVEAVVLEAMRLSPPAYIVGRCANRDTQLGAYRLPKGTTVLVSPYLLHRDPLRWGPTAADFAPQRWLDMQRGQQQQQPQGGQQRSPPPAAACPHAAAATGSSGGEQQQAGAGGVAFLTGMGPNGAYIPFGAGQRNCIGTGFAMMEAVLVLATVLQKYELRPLPGARFPQAQAQITLRPQEARLLLRRR